MTTLHAFSRWTARLQGAVLLAACAAFAAPAPALAADTTLTVGVVGKGLSSAWAVYIGKNKGFFAEQGLQLDIMSAPSSSAVIQWLAAGSAMIGEAGLADPITAISKGAKISLLRGEIEAVPFAIQTKDTTKKMTDLRGKMVSIGGAADITRIYFEKTAEPAGLKKGEYEYVYGGSTPARYAALQSGAADAAVLLPPFFFKASPGFHTLVIIGDVVKDMPFTVLSANTAWGRAHKDEVKKFLAAMARSTDWFNDPANRKEAIDILVAESGGSANREDVEQTYDLFHKIKAYSRAGVITSQQISSLANPLKELGVIDQTDTALYLDPELSSLTAAFK
jgi:ABC-type nitrate/sulfonate/bicarbonate transport system substrate-binding protein